MLLICNLFTTGLGQTKEQQEFAVVSLSQGCSLQTSVALKTSTRLTIS